MDDNNLRSNVPVLVGPLNACNNSPSQSIMSYCLLPTYRHVETSYYHNNETDCNVLTCIVNVESYI